jgi:hypothetical protein
MIEEEVGNEKSATTCEHGCSSEKPITVSGQEVGNKISAAVIENGYGSEKSAATSEYEVSCKNSTAYELVSPFFWSRNEK